MVEDLLAQWNLISLRPYKAVTFTSTDRKGNVIYHTDCMLTLLHDHAVVCLTTLRDKKERKRLMVELSNPPMNVVPY